MVQKTIDLDAALAQRLEALAAATGRQESDLIREGIHAVLAKAQDRATEEETPRDWRAAVARAAGLWATHDSLDLILAENRGRARRRFAHIYDEDER